MKTRKALEGPFTPVLDALLRPRGYLKDGRYWRRENPDTIFVIELRRHETFYEVWFGVWIKALGEVDLSEIKSTIFRCHVLIKFENICPPLIVHFLCRALWMRHDYFEDLKLDLADDPEDLREVEIQIDFEAPRPTMEERAAILREAMAEQGLPFLEGLQTADGQQKFLENDELFRAAAEPVFEHLGIEPSEEISLTVFELGLSDEITEVEIRVHGKRL